MAYTLAAMVTEVYERGFHYLNDSSTGTTRVKRWLNDAMHNIDDQERWPYRMTSTTGTTPLTITDLGDIETVLDATNDNPLIPQARDTLLQIYGDLTTGGTADYFYLNGQAITSYPVTTNTLTVNYYKVGPDLSADSDEPLMPDRFRPAIVEAACAKAYRDSDNQQMAAVCQAEVDRIVDRMRAFYTLQPGTQDVLVYGNSFDW